MSADIVNLRLARKAKRRAAADETAARQRSKHGRTRGEREAGAIDRERVTRYLDGHRLAPDDPHGDAS